MNKLSKEKSPYLLQHANNPVDWYPWGEEAFEKAKQENKPIFLSIGYSTCHWCHVMEHESFENKTIAELMNKYFVCIKVDREERPDVDKVYMSAVQTMIGSGGWPLSVFLTPDLKPFYGGTYFPPKDAHGRPGFPTVLERIHQAWNEEQQEILNSGNQLIEMLQHKHLAKNENEIIDENLIRRTYHQLAAAYDAKHGGFGTAPKFPRPVMFEFLFQYFNRTQEKEALTMSLTTLMAMASGGMYDHLGGGFHRYSVDAQWKVPHFEKMLYDQAQLAHSYLDAYQITHDDFFATIAKETLDYVLREMTDKNGGFYSAQDADSFSTENSSQKKEGAFYVWEKSEIEKILSQEESKIFCHYYNIDERGNVFSDPHNEFQNKNILYAPFTIEQTAKHTSCTIEQVQKLLHSSKQKLFEARKQKSYPHRDEKILTGWNSLMLSAFAHASQIFNEEKYFQTAVNAINFLYKNLYDNSTKILFRRYCDGETKYDAQLDDYAFFIQALIDVYEITFDIQWLEKALEIQKTQIALFWDSAEGGFFDVSGKDSSILVRIKEGYDGAEPSGNSTSVKNLLRLFSYCNDKELQNYAEKTLKYFSTTLQQSPQLMPQLISTIERYYTSPQQVVIAGKRSNLEFKKYVQEIEQHYNPNKIIFLIDENTQEYFSQKHSFLQNITLQEKVVVYICENNTCGIPIITIEQLQEKLKKNKISIANSL